MPCPVFFLLSKIRRRKIEVGRTRAA